MNAAEYVDRVRCRRLLDADPAKIQKSQVDPTPKLDSETPAAYDFQPEPSDIRVLGLIELVLKKRQELHRVLRDRTKHAELLPRLLAISLTGFVLFGITMSLVLSVAGRWPALTAIATWIDKPAAGLIAFKTISSPWGHLAPGSAAKPSFSQAHMHLDWWPRAAWPFRACISTACLPACE